MIINEIDIEDLLKSVYTTKGLRWITDSVIDHTISISKYNPLAGSSYIKLPKEIEYPKKIFINLQNMNDNTLNGAYSNT